MPEHKERMTIYYWPDRQALTTYFKAHYNMTEAEINIEIEKAQHEFKLRQHTPVNIKDLYQKVGLSILKQHPNGIRQYCKLNGVCPYMGTHNGLCHWKAACPFREEIIV